MMDQAVTDAIASLRQELADIRATEDPDERLRALKPLAAGIQQMYARAARLRQGEALRLYRDGDLPLSELGRLTGLSKARVHQLVQGLPRKTCERKTVPVRIPPVPVLPEVELGERAPATALYRLWSADGTLLYVGIADNLKARFDDHKKEKRWWGDVAKVTVVWYGSRKDAFQAEDIAIKTEHPIHNIAGVISERLAG